jgi:hypothetical protein
MLEELLPLLIPLIVIQFTLMALALISLKKRETVRFGNKSIWVLIIVCGSLLGSIAYFIFGGQNDADSGSH